MTKTCAPPLVLVGPMGAGKTTIGRRLAAQLGREFVDSDAEIERRTGAVIPLIFELEGESGFRVREEKVVMELCARSDTIIATGGGAVLSAATRSRLGDCFVVYLQASPDEQWRRVRHDRNRPLLQHADPRERLRELLAAREPLYLEVADLVVDTGRGHVRQAVQQILARLDEIAPLGSNPERRVPPPYQGGGQEGV